ncbi:predicted protein [Thalassiosira pseudonana CCMP1335]|uniref:Enkurin domain-containing protein n=1 Tax=Thalassiosira pseudonana TaxID=35128 RepID=B5YP57_THAPS|nr:predicted protein [Thalassiosira pseudonana CCMP1335]ACI64400.1 predicted protein [Thalassiosira pseudonana CCMP1335]
MIISFVDAGHGNENLSPTGLASLIAKRQTSGDDARCLIAPLPIEVNEDGSDQSFTATQRKTPPKKNHLRANRLALKETQKSNRKAEIEDKLQEEVRAKKKEHKKKQLYGNIKSKIVDHTTSSPKQPALSINPTNVDEDSLQLFTFALSSRSDESSSPCHIAFGRKIASRASSNSRIESAPQPTPNQLRTTNTSFQRHQSYGKVPCYITKRRAKIEEAEQERRLAEQNAPPAPGLVLMDEAERLETLRVLEENEKKERDQLRKIPFSMNAHRAARLREAIDHRLREIENAKRIFSKDKVFVAQSDD